MQSLAQILYTLRVQFMIVELKHALLSVIQVTCFVLFLQLFLFLIAIFSMVGFSSASYTAIPSYIFNHFTLKYAENINFPLHMSHIFLFILVFRIWRYFNSIISPNCLFSLFLSPVRFSDIEWQ